MAEILRLEKADAPPRPDPGAFVKTATAGEIMTTLGLIQSLDGGGVSMVAGAPGIGKTRTLLHLAEEQPGAALYIRIAKGEGRPWGIAYSILRGLGTGAHMDKDFLSGGLTRARERLASYIGPRCLVLVDEAQNLNEYDDKTRLMGAGFEWLRACQEEGGFALAFCGDLSLVKIMADNPQLDSRMRRPLILKGAAKADVAALAEGWGVSDGPSLSALAAVAKKRGGLRNVVNVLSTATDLGGGRATPASIKAAIDMEGLGPKGVL